MCSGPVTNKASGEGFDMEISIKAVTLRKGVEMRYDNMPAALRHRQDDDLLANTQMHTCSTQNKK